MGNHTWHQLTGEGVENNLPKIKQIPITQISYHIARFWNYVEKTDSCWNWTGYKENGYGRFSIYNTKFFTHRFAFEMKNGMIDPELCLDHLCRNHSCVNPDHLEAVSIGENVRRGIATPAINFNKVHCIRGHLLSGDNLYLTNDGRRQCRCCARIRTAEHRKKQEVNYRT